MEYVRSGDTIVVTDTTDWYEPEHHPDPAAPAAQMG